MLSVEPILERAFRMSGPAAVPGRDVVLEAAVAAVEDGVAGLAAVVRARDVAVVETELRVAAAAVVEVLGLVESAEDAVIQRFIHWKSRHSLFE